MAISMDKNDKSWLEKKEEEGASILDTENAHFSKGHLSSSDFE